MRPPSCIASGDRYIDQKTGKWVQLHRCTTMRNHFEFMRNQEQPS